MVRAFCEARPCVEGPAGRKRATGSFLALLRLALTGPATCFAFADQDDVWLPDKLAHGVRALNGVPADQPGLYFCARTLVDTDLRPFGQVGPPLTLGFPAALTQNVAPGCCMMLNRSAAELLGAAAEPDGCWHDWWAYLLIAAHGGQVIAGEDADILYRQHGGNLVGEPRGLGHRIISAARRGRGPFMTLFWRQIDALRSAPTPLPAKTQAMLTVIQKARAGRITARLRALAIPGFVRQTWAETLLFRLWFLLG